VTPDAAGTGWRAARSAVDSVCAWNQERASGPPHPTARRKGNSEVLRLIPRGKRNDVIAQELVADQETVASA
jgi:DNA-binding NarL/FixJ family response regulator